MTTLRTVTTIAATALLLSACGGGGAPANPVTSATSASVSSSAPTTSSPPTTSAAASDPQPGDPCNRFVGLPLSLIYSDDGRGPQCITGASTATDKTGFSVSACNPAQEDTSEKIISWLSQDLNAPDQHEYAAYADGNIVIVPNASPHLPAAFIGILTAVGVAACQSSG